MLLQILNDRFGLALPVDRADTISGYVWHHLGRLPAVGDTVPLSARASSDAPDVSATPPELRVDSVDGTLVERVSFILPRDEPDGGPA